MVIAAVARAEAGAAGVAAPVGAAAVLDAVAADRADKVVAAAVPDAAVLVEDPALVVYYTKFCVGTPDIDTNPEFI